MGNVTFTCFQSIHGGTRTGLGKDASDEQLRMNESGEVPGSGRATQSSPHGLEEQLGYVLGGGAEEKRDAFGPVW